MSSSDEEAASPELGASSSKDACVTPMASEISDSEIEDLPRKKKRGHVKDTREWVGSDLWEIRDHEQEEIDHLLFTQCKKLMDVTRLFRLTTCKSKPDDIFLNSADGSAEINFANYLSMDQHGGQLTGALYEGAGDDGQGGGGKAPAETTVLPQIQHRTGAAPLSAESDVRSLQALHAEQDSEEEEGCRMPAAANLAPAGAAGSGRLTPAPEWKNAT